MINRIYIPSCIGIVVFSNSLKLLCSSNDVKNAKMHMDDEKLLLKHTRDRHNAFHA